MGWEKDTAALNNEKIAKAMNSNRMKKLADSKFAKKLTSASAKLKGMTSEAIEAVSSKIKIRMPLCKILRIKKSNSWFQRP